MKRARGSSRSSNVLVVISSMGDRSWAAEVESAAAEICATVCSRKAALQRKRNGRTLFVASYHHEFDDDELDWATKTPGVELVNLDFLKRLKSEPGLSVVASCLPPGVPLVPWKPFSSECDEVPMIQSWSEFAAMQERRVFGSSGTEIGLVAIGEEGDFAAASDILSKVAEFFRAFFSPATVVVLDERVKRSAKLRSEPVDYLDALAALEKTRRKRKNMYALIGIINLDVVDGDLDATIYGRATGDGDCIISTKHFSSINRVFFSTAAHEVAHIFGLDHCVFFDCVMNPEADSEEESKGSSLLCPVCLHKLQSCLQFDIAERNDKLRSAYRALGMLEDERELDYWLGKS